MTYMTYMSRYDNLKGIGSQEKAPLNLKYVILLVFGMIQLPLHESNHLSFKTCG